jgi:hypothetical protein
VLPSKVVTLKLAVSSMAIKKTKKNLLFAITINLGCA